MKYSPTIGAYHRGVVTGSMTLRVETSELLRFVDGQLAAGRLRVARGNEFTAGD